MTNEELIEHIKYSLKIGADVTLTEEDAKQIIKALEQLPEIKDAYDKGYKDGQEALAVHLELCKEEGSVITVPEGATNGDMIKAMFQNWTISEGETMVCFYIPMTNGGYEYNAFSKDWWNSPYRKEPE